MISKTRNRQEYCTSQNHTASSMDIITPATLLIQQQCSLQYRPQAQELWLPRRQYFIQKVEEDLGEGHTINLENFNKPTPWISTTVKICVASPYCKPQSLKTIRVSMKLEHRDSTFLLLILREKLRHSWKHYWVTTVLASNTAPTIVLEQQKQKRKFKGLLLDGRYSLCFTAQYLV